MKPDIVRRYAYNPILTKGEIPYAVETVHNAAVVKHDGEYIMLFDPIFVPDDRLSARPAAATDSGS